MNSLTVYLVTAVIVFGVGLGGVFLCAHPLRRILAVNIAGSGVFMMLVAIARRPSADAARLADVVNGLETVVRGSPDAAPDPVPHALVLTGIVVAVSATAVALALVRKLAGSSGVVE